MIKSFVVVTVFFLACALYQVEGEPIHRTTDGEAVYLAKCVSCHMIDGKGIAGVFPPLNNTSWVTGDKGRLIRVVLDGLSGPVEVQGETYAGIMSGWKAILSDEEVAAVLTYIRESFGNDASPVKTAEVALVRNTSKQRSKPWTAAELGQEANQGIPGDS